MKIAIVGAGISGLYLSQKLAEKGYEVTVFEKNKEIGKQACSGLFSQRILRFIPESKDLVQNQIEYALLHFPKKTIKIRFSGRFLVMKHYELDRLASLSAQKAGVKIVLNKKVNSFPEGFDRIIGCDGAVSQIRNLLKLKDPKFRLGIQGFVFENNSSDSKKPFVETWPTKSGFLWKIPRGENIEYGIIENIDKAKEIFDEFLKKEKIYLKDIKSALIPEGLILSYNPKVTLCGDSLGLTKPWSGGGVIWSLVASDILLKNFPDFLKYNKAVKRFFLPRIVFSRIVTRVVYFLGFNASVFLPREVKIESDFLV